jgi:hypothetical protein
MLNAPAEKVKAPLVIGVAGHRDLRPEDVPQLESAVTEILVELKSKYCATPLILISSLAEGADRLAARVALKMDARLVVPLPMPVAMYETDFKEQESRKEFHELLDQAVYSFEAPLLSPAQKVSVDGRERNLQYEEAGKYIARESQIVIALWDGVANGKTGGTAVVVKFQTEGMDEDMDNLEPRELFPVYHIPTPRKSKPDLDDEPFKRKIIYPPSFEKNKETEKEKAEARKEAEAYYHRLFSNLDQFNQAVMESGGASEQPAQANSGLISGAALALLSDNERLVLDRYTTIDTLAIRFQTRLLRAHRTIHWFVFAAFVLFVFFAHFPKLGPLPEHSAWWMIAAWLTLGIVVWNYIEARHARLDSKALDYRAVAEGCRVSIFWQTNGITESIADHYLGQQRTELDWIRNGLRGWDIVPRPVRPVSAPDAPARVDLALNHWIDVQHHYFEHKVESETEHMEQMERRVRHLINAGLFLAAVAVVLAVIQQLKRPEWMECKHCDWISWLIILIDVLLAGGALLHHANQRMARAEHIKQYKRMRAIFRNAGQIIRRHLQAGDIAGARECLKKLGQEALAENAEWVLLHRERPLELPHP